MAQVGLDGVGKVYTDGTEAVTDLDLDIGLTSAPPFNMSVDNRQRRR